MTNLTGPAVQPVMRFTCCGLLIALALAFAIPVEAARKSKSRPAAGGSADDYKANSVLKKGLEALETKQEDRGVKLLASIPTMFPESKVRYQAYMALGKFYTEKRNYELAGKQLRQVTDSEDESEAAEALYRLGICFYSMNSYDKAFMYLRKVTNEYPWSVYANEAYYYIGLCHFALRRWSRAVEALKMVGTSIPMTDVIDRRAEAGQRFHVKVLDKDLIVLVKSGDTLKVGLAAASGDQEEVVLEPLGRSGDTFVGSIESAPGDAKAGDGILQIIGGDVITVSYVDENSGTGKRQVQVLERVQMVSTAAAGFTDGAFREYVKGVFSDTECFIRVRDLDLDVSPERDALTVEVAVQYVKAKEKDETREGIDFDDGEEEIITRDSLRLTLTETEPHSGIFTGITTPTSASFTDEVTTADSILHVQEGDTLVLEYVDDLHNQSGGSRHITASAQLLTGSIRDVKIEHREVQSLDLRARKELIEARIMLKLGQIFKEVGLKKQANEKADEGLGKVEDVIRLSLRASLDRSLVEEAFSVKWDLLLVKDQIREAIQVCNTLTKLFPDSTLVDLALFKMGEAKLADGDQQDLDGAIQIFSGITGLKQSDLKAEAQFKIAEAREVQAAKMVHGQSASLMNRSMLEYKKCADLYPESPFAGDSLEKIANFYISTKDYRRAVELMQQVFMEYPDASFLDKMLLKWAIAAYRLGQLQAANEKLVQLLSEYPNSPLAAKAREYQKVIERKIGG